MAAALMAPVKLRLVVAVMVADLMLRLPGAMCSHHTAYLRPFETCVVYRAQGVLCV